MIKEITKKAKKSKVEVFDERKAPNRDTCVPACSLICEHLAQDVYAQASKDCGADAPHP